MHYGIDSEGTDALAVKLLRNVLAVGDYRGETDAEPVGYLLVDIALDNQRKDLNLTVGQHLLGGGYGLGRRQTPAMRMRPLLKREERLYQYMFRYADAKTMKLVEV